jgi:hypothetical protein
MFARQIVIILLSLLSLELSGCTGERLKSTSVGLAITHDVIAA